MHSMGRRRKPQRKRSNRKCIMHTISIYKHFQELRDRFLISIFFIVSASLVGWFIKDGIIVFLTKPLQQTLYYNTPSGGLTFLIKVSILFGVLVSMPIIYSQFWGFIAPAFPPLHKKFIRRITFFSTTLFLSGVSFSYFVLLPAALKLFSRFQDVSLAPLISGDAYFAFVSSYLIWFGILFQIPILFLVLNKLGFINRSHLARFLPYSFLVSFVVAAFITPTPDPINQTMVGLPIFLLFLISWVFVKEEGIYHVISI